MSGSWLAANLTRVLAAAAGTAVVLTLADWVSWVFSVAAGPAVLTPLAIHAIGLRWPEEVVNALTYFLCFCYFYGCAAAISRMRFRRYAIVTMILASMVTYVVVTRYFKF